MMAESGHSAEMKGNEEMSKSPDEKKSTAIVEYKTWQPTEFNLLQMNTNLNKPPSNWLRSKSRWEQYIRDAVWSKERSDMSSLVMAHKSPSKVGEVDVISDSDNIKKLLTIPYSKSHVSMMVHRVGKTILIDEFDIHKHLLRQQKDDWKWLRSFYYDTVLQSMQGEKCFGRRTKTRDFLQNQNMFSKFLYYSLPSNESKPAEPTTQPGCSNNQPDTSPECNNSEEKYRSEEFQRTHLWTFEDIRMWIGTDLPIFGGSNHPCVSLKLRDARKPINVLTGLDFWLDNLMCNVPELAMCYHVNGIVQRYEIMKTEDIPKLENSQFEPEVIKDIAQNILSFLKSNATKEGHTYWLFKGSDQDVVKLYDLTCLCGEEGSDARNPFSVPLGVLLYRVAQNTWQASGRKKSGLIKTLLKSCILLLDRTAHAHIVTSANYLLADLYIKNDLYDQSLEKQDEEEIEDENEDDFTEREKNKNSSKPHRSPVKSKAVSPTASQKSGKAAEMPVNVLCLPENGAREQQILRYNPVTGNVEERCYEALEYIKQSMICLDENSEKEQLDGPQRHVNPNEVIPLKYERLYPDKNSDDNTNTDQQPNDEIPLVTCQQTFPPDSWHKSTKVSLLHKACLIFYWLADCKIKQYKFGAAMRYTRKALHCFSSVYTITNYEDVELLSALLGQSGDTHVMLVHDMKNSAEHLTNYNKPHNVTETQVIDSVKLVLPTHEYLMFAEYSSSIEHNLTMSCHSYRLAIDIVMGTKLEQTIRKNLSKRYGNVCNELGVYFMNQTASLINDDISSSNQDQILGYFNKSRENLNNGISAFESIEDEMNLALLYSNRARLMRLLAQSSCDLLSDSSAVREFTEKERINYQKAVDDYKQALTVLHQRDGKSEIWDSITWELSSTFFTMATMLQDFAPLSTQSQEEIEKEVTCLMNEALKYCDVTEQSSRLPTCQYRAATIHHRLASLYHNSYRNQVTEQKRRHLRTLAEWHYGKCSKYFQLVESPCELLRVQLERVAMCEYQLTCQTSANTKMKTISSALDYLFDCRLPLLNIVQQMDDQTEFEAYRIETGKLSKILHSRLQFITLQLVKNINTLKKSEKKDAQLDLYKNMYAVTLKYPYKEDTTSALYENCTAITKIIETLQQLYHPESPTDLSSK